MPFSDDDLKRLKEAAKMRGGIVSFEDVRPLLSRLEAAEKCLETANQEGGIDSNLYEAWGKACGK